MLRELRCTKCYRLLAKVGVFDELEIKCPRCRHIIHLKAGSLRTTNTEPQCQSPSSPG
ncbi:MAG: Com family DNA-binding transcriptional regulator [Halieaceae bacterium]|nr:Com family DNA-binding transcriptional regulator [Halieaceae bacterium]MCP5014248.1 Com family DNA-binding transcriptional regulator [Ketobacter sp.]